MRHQKTLSKYEEEVTQQEIEPVTDEELEQAYQDCLKAYNYSKPAVAPPKQMTKRKYVAIRKMAHDYWKHRKMKPGIQNI